MEIVKDSILSMAKEGRISLQVTNVYFGSLLQFETVPDDWVWYIKGSVPCVGREEGFMFLTKEGWNANKDKIEAAFNTSSNKRGTWQDFLDHVDEHFKEIELATRRKITLLQNKLEQYEDVSIRHNL